MSRDRLAIISEALLLLLSSFCPLGTPCVPFFPRRGKIRFPTSLVPGRGLPCSFLSCFSAGGGRGCCLLSARVGNGAIFGGFARGEMAFVVLVLDGILK